MKTYRLSLARVPTLEIQPTPSGRYNALSSAVPDANRRQCPLTKRDRFGSGRTPAAAECSAIWYHRHVTHFVDLSPYTYDDEDIIETSSGWIMHRPRYERINIGWIDAPHDFARGPTLSWFADALLDIIAGPRINTMRGFHQCTFCPEPDITMDMMIEVDHRSGPVLLGHTEIRIPASTGSMFAAPSLIWHYVTVHHYQPPDDFIDAVQKYDHNWTTEPSPWIPQRADHISFD